MKRPLACMLASLVLVTSMGCLTGCGNDHQVVAVNETCISCHDEKDTYDVTDPSGATDCGLTLTVTTSADSLVLCTPIFTSEDGSKYIPVTYSNISVSDGTATVQLEEGLWVIAREKDSKSKSVLVKASASGENTSIKL